jgi:hypothetical protein
MVTMVTKTSRMSSHTENAKPRRAIPPPTPLLEWAAVDERVDKRGGCSLLADSPGLWVYDHPIVIGHCPELSPTAAVVGLGRETCRPSVAARVVGGLAVASAVVLPGQNVQSLLSSGVPSALRQLRAEFRNFFALSMSRPRRGGQLPRAA